MINYLLRFFKNNNKQLNTNNIKINLKQVIKTVYHRIINYIDYKMNKAIIIQNYKIITQH